MRLDGPDMIDDLLRRGIRGHAMAKAAVEMGAWALAADRQGVSLSRLLGGTRKAIATGISIGIQASPRALADQAGAAMERGYRKIKMKIRPGADIEYIAAVREGLGPRAPLMADANSAYTPAHADHLADLDAYRLLMIEQPLAQDDLRRHAQLQDRLDTPICLDESIPHAAATEDMLALGAGRIVNVKPGAGGRLHAGEGDPRPLPEPRRAGLVRRDARERRRPRPQRRARLAPQLHHPRRRQPRARATGRRTS